MLYEVRRAPGTDTFSAPWDDAAWEGACVAELACARPEGSGHRPRTRVRLLHDEHGLHGIFRVEDRWVRSRATRFNDPVCKDSCVEFFVQPRPEQGYFNFEMNCGGTLLASYIEDPERTPGGFRAFTRMPAEHGAMVQVRHSLPAVVWPEIEDAVTWYNSFFIPFRLLEEYVGPLGAATAGRQWRGNFYKCGDDTSHPHWLSWAPVGKLDFHRPQDFGVLRFNA